MRGDDNLGMQNKTKKQHKGMKYVSYDGGGEQPSLMEQSIFNCKILYKPVQFASLQVTIIIIFKYHL